MEITIKKLTMRNFKGVRGERVVEFSPSVTKIYGANRTGKTTIADAFRWCMFGKNTEGKQDFGIKTKDAQGNVIPELEHAVSVVLVVDGREVTITRTYTEKWSKPKGVAQKQLTGHTTTYHVDGQLYTQGDFNAYINSLCNESLFMAITSPSYFVSLKPDQQRSMLTEMVSETSPAQVAKGNAQFEALLQIMGEQDMVQFRQHLAYQMKEIKDELKRIPVRISEQEITWLRQHGYEAQAQQAEKARDKAISELKATQIQGTDQWQTLFQNAQYLSGAAFDSILEELRNMVKGIEDSNVRSALNAQLDGLQQQVVGSKNPFKLLVQSIKQYNQAADGTIEKKQQFAQMFTAIGGSIDMVKGSFDSVVGALKDMGLAGDEMTQEMLGDISEMMGGAATLAKGIASGNPMDIISGGVSLITSAISLFDSTSRRIRREMKQHEKQLKVLQRAYAQLSWETDNAVGEGYYSSAQKEIENLKKQQDEYKELARLEQSKKSKNRDDDKVQEYLQNAEDAARQIADLEREITESLVQTNFKDLANELADAWADCFSDMEDSAESFDEIWKTTIANAVKNSLKLKLIEPRINDFTNALAAHMGANNNSVAGFDFAYWKSMLKNAGDAFTSGLAEFEEFFRDMGDEMEDASDTLEGQIKGVTEETASKLAGEITAMRIRQVDMLLVQQNIRSCMESVDSTVRNAISYLSTIANNTGAGNRVLGEIRNQLGDIKATIASDPLRAKGLTK